jgi:hypothetical protein
MSHDAKRATTSNPEADVKPEGRVYEAPQLSEYGSVAKLTQTGGMTSYDFIIFRRMGR